MRSDGSTEAARPDSGDDRRIVEAYQVENEYGRTIESYQGQLSGGPEKRTVEFLRVGRLVLIYQTLDGGETGIWSKEKRAWELLPKETQD